MKLLNVFGKGLQSLWFWIISGPIVWFYDILNWISAIVVFLAGPIAMNYVPYGPSTAVITILSGVALLLCMVRSYRQRKDVTAGTVFMLILSLIVFAICTFINVTHAQHGVQFVLIWAGSLVVLYVLYSCYAEVERRRKHPKTTEQTLTKS